VTTYRLQRSSGADLALHREHAAIARPRHGDVRWDDFDRAAYDDDVLDEAAVLWETRAVQEMHSLALFTEVVGHLHLLGAPLDWSGAFARMIADEVRHTDLCLRMCELLGRPAAPEIDPGELHLMSRNSRSHVRQTIVAAFCIGETLSGRMFRSALRVTDVPVARDVVSAIIVDETFHGELGWELGALLMRSDGPAFETERAELAHRLPFLFRHFAKQCHATISPAAARDVPAVDERPNFGTLSNAGYACAFFDGMEQDVVPGLVAIGLPEAEAAYADLVKSL
jgi:hypothetical protein